MCGYTAVLEDVLVLNFMNTFFTYVCFFGYSFLSLSFSCIFCCCIDLRRIKSNILDDLIRELYSFNRLSFIVVPVEKFM